MVLNVRIRELRIKFGVSQEKLGKILNLTQQAVARWENGSSEPDSENIQKLAKYFNVTTDYLLGNSNIPDPIPPDTATALKKVAELEAALAAERAEKAQILAESTAKDKIIANVKTALNIAETKTTTLQSEKFNQESELKSLESELLSLTSQSILVKP